MADGDGEVPGTVPHYDIPTTNNPSRTAPPQVVFVVDSSYAPTARTSLTYKEVFPEKAILGLAISLILSGVLSIIIKVY